MPVANRVLRFTGKKLPPAAGMGRTKGSQNRVTKLLKDAILLAAVQADAQIKLAAGDPSEATLEGYLTWAAVNHPVQFAVLLGKVLPLQKALSPDGDAQTAQSSNKYEIGQALAFSLRLSDVGP